MAGIFMPGPGLGPGQTYDSAGRIIPIAPNSSYGDPSNFTAAANKQGSDYDTIMSNYSKLFNAPPSTPISYTGSPDVTSAMSNLNNLATTGGYSDQNIADLRARGVAPTRSIYSQAQEGLNRQKAIQGGYSPGFGAASAKMAREESQQISDIGTNVNAGIAQAVAQNRLAASSPYASLASSEAGRGLDVSKFNVDLANQDKARQLQATEGMRGIYGTNPALTSVFGNQVSDAARLGQGQQQLNIQRRNADVNNLARLGAIA